MSWMIELPPEEEAPEEIEKAVEPPPPPPPKHDGRAFARASWACTIFMHVVFNERDLDRAPKNGARFRYLLVEALCWASDSRLNMLAKAEPALIEVFREFELAHRTPGVFFKRYNVGSLLRYGSEPQQKFEELYGA